MVLIFRSGCQASPVASSLLLIVGPNQNRSQSLHRFCLPQLPEHSHWWCGRPLGRSEMNSQSSQAFWIFVFVSVLTCASRFPEVETQVEPLLRTASARLLGSPILSNGSCDGSTARAAHCSRYQLDGAPRAALFRLQLQQLLSVGPGAQTRKCHCNRELGVVSVSYEAHMR